MPITLQVLHQCMMYLEAKMAGSAIIRNRSMTICKPGEGVLEHADHRIKIYDPKNWRHTARELARYTMATQKVFQDAAQLPSAEIPDIRVVEHIRSLFV